MKHDSDVFHRTELLKIRFQLLRAGVNGQIADEKVAVTFSFQCGRHLELLKEILNLKIAHVCASHLFAQGKHSYCDFNEISSQPETEMIVLNFFFLLNNFFSKLRKTQFQKSY